MARGPILFEYDPAKSVANKSKHGIDFDEAQALWQDPFQVIFSARTDGETRYLGIGMVAGRHWSAVFTLRADAIRLISVRRSRTSEIERYEDR